MAQTIPDPTGPALLARCYDEFTFLSRCLPSLFIAENRASLNMGSMNFSIHPVAAKIKQWVHPLEQAYAEGTEDIIFRNTIYLGRGQMARSNAEQVAKIRRTVEELGLEVATPAEARAMPSLKGGDQVAF